MIAAEAATKAVAYSSGKQRTDLDDDELLRLALTKLVEIVGEAAKHVSPETRVAMPEVPWQPTRSGTIMRFSDAITAP